MPRIATLEKAGNPRDLSIRYRVGPDDITASARLYSKSARRTVMIVSHGGQRNNNGGTHGLQTRSFAFLVPYRHRLMRSTPPYGEEWPARAAALLAEHEAEFRTVGIPSIYLAPHAFDNLNNDYDRNGAVYAAALDLWDIIVLEDLSVWTSGSPEFPLYRFLNGTPALVSHYDSFLMHCCRSEQQSAGGHCTHTSGAAPSALYSHDDSVHIPFA